MSPESTPDVEPRTDSQSRASTESKEADWIADGTEPSEEAFSLVDPLLYAPLLLVGTALVVFPEPATTLVGVVCIAVGVVLAAADLTSPPGQGG